MANTRQVLAAFVCPRLSGIGVSQRIELLRALSEVGPQDAEAGRFRDLADDLADVESRQAELALNYGTDGRKS